MDMGNEFFSLGTSSHHPPAETDSPGNAGPVGRNQHRPYMQTRRNPMRFPAGLWTSRRRVLCDMEEPASVPIILGPASRRSGAIANCRIRAQRGHSLPPSQVRANHYHRKTSEWFAVVKAKALLKLADAEANEWNEIQLQAA